MDILVENYPVYFWIAAVSTFLFILKMVLAMIGIDGDTDVDFGDDVSAETGADSALQFFSIQAVLGFFMGLGWMGLTARAEFGVSSPIALLYAVLFGMALFFLSAKLMRFLTSLSEDKTFNVHSAIGSRGRAYITIPEAGSGSGQVEVTAAGRKKIFNAESMDVRIESFQNILVVDVKGSDTLLVKLDEEV